jgi:hypothetical protein
LAAALAEAHEASHRGRSACSTAALDVRDLDADRVIGIVGALTVVIATG